MTTTPTQPQRNSWPKPGEGRQAVRVYPEGSRQSRPPVRAEPSGNNNADALNPLVAAVLAAPSPNIWTDSFTKVNRAE